MQLIRTSVFIKNLFIALRKEKITYFPSLNKKDITNDRKF